ncbi:MAG: 50S ribosomal protein L21 [Actinomycetia bacterium]|nr:50S ribosomal protein L21 [Actinomycetes bacterium]
MYAIVETGGKQYRVSAGDSITVEKLAAQPGDRVRLKVLMLADGSQISTESAALSQAQVDALVVEHLLGPKALIFKFKKRKSYHRLRGHRQNLTRLQIEAVSATPIVVKPARTRKATAKAAAETTDKVAKTAQAAAIKDEVVANAGDAAAAKKPAVRTRKASAAAETAGTGSASTTSASGVVKTTRSATKATTTEKPATKSTKTAKTAAASSAEAETEAAVAAEAPAAAKAPRTRRKPAADMAENSPENAE